MTEKNRPTVPELDVLSEGYNRDPHSQIAALRTKGPVARSVRGWEILRYETARTMLRDRALQPPDAEHALARGASELMASFVRDGLLLDMEPTRHKQVRRVMLEAFSLRRIDQRKDVMQTIANELLDNMSGRSAIEFIADFSHQYSIRVLCSLLGVDEKDIPQFDKATTQLRLMSSIPLEPALPQLDKALQTLWDYSKRLVDARIAEPRNDFISGLIEAQRTEGALTESELIWGIANLLFAGHETTRNQLATTMRALFENPDAWEAMKQGPDAIFSAMSEAMRFYPVVFYLRRIVQEPVSYDGIDFQPGDNIILNWLAVSRDPEHFDDPDHFHWDRSPKANEINFGYGQHLCLGHALAKAEMVEALTVLRERWDEFAINGPIELTPFSNTLGGLVALPLKVAEHQPGG